ncbi:unnamed protein product [Lactuca virosa]|uniref:Uncharacterized protein n=1 Tax=Lactuca virosa TaxID=75947 RepID=A0AAU9PLS8_9ASTR|nr:unnamed protein product [Lactuca virosa]
MSSHLRWGWSAVQEKQGRKSPSVLLGLPIDYMRWQPGSYRRSQERLVVFQPSKREIRNQMEVAPTGVGGRWWWSSDVRLVAAMVVDIEAATDGGLTGGVGIDRQ